MSNSVNSEITVVGAGSWATALVKILSENATRVNWWMHTPEAINHVKRYGHNPKYLTDVQIDLNKVFPTHDLEELIRNSRIIILALPAVFLDQTLAGCSEAVQDGTRFFSAIKGMVPEYHLLVSDFLTERVGLKPHQVGVIAGPCHSEEVALERQSYLTVSSNDIENAREMAAFLSCRYVHTQVIPEDVQGIEFATVMKNIFSLAVGITRGLNYGDNFQAVLVSNAMQEMKSFLDIAVPNPKRNLNESAYLGDLLVTAYSQFSRNRIFGKMIGKGYTVKSAQLEMNMIAEGYFASKSLHEINRTLKVNLPICDFVYRILYENSPAQNELVKLEKHLH